MVSQGQYANGIVLLRNPEPLQDASRSGAIVIDEEDTEISHWDFLEMVGVKKGIDYGQSPAGQTHAWLITVVNSLPAPLVLEKIHLISGTQVGYAAITNFTKVIPGTEDQIPGVRDDPTFDPDDEGDGRLTAAGAWTFSSQSNDAFEIAMRFSHRTSTGDPGKAVGIAVKFRPLWHEPVTATTADLDSFNTPETDTPEKLLQAFYDQKAGDQGSYSSIGTETTVSARYSKGPGPREGNPSCSVVAWVQPAGS